MQRAALAFLLLTTALAGCLSGGDEDATPPTFVDRDTLEGAEYVFDVTDADGNFLREAAWRVVTGTGNCCENYVTTTATGRILDFGGTFIHYSDDEGLTWTVVETTLPHPNGEGAIVAAPGGDVVGIGWYPYTGDQAIGFKYEADTDEWLFSDIPSPLHTPFWDREWIVALPGPFTVDGEEVEYITLARGGTAYKESLMMSTDGYTYDAVSLSDVESIFNAPTTLTALDADPDTERDWMQPLHETAISPIGNGRGLQTVSGLTGPNDEGDCPRLFNDQAQWSCLDLVEATLPRGSLLMDSTGALHVVATNSTGFTYHISHDGGRSWNATEWTLPHNMTILNWDFKAHAALDHTVVAIHAATEDGFGQDLAYRFNGLDATPEFMEILWVSDGKAQLGGGGVTSQDDRFDFTTVAFLPDGRIVMSMQDSRFPNSGEPQISSNQFSSVDPVLVIELPAAT